MRIITETPRLQKLAAEQHIQEKFSFWESYSRQYLRFSAGEEILSAGEETPGFYFLLEGQMRIYSLGRDGKVFLLVLADAGDGSLLGDVEYLSQCPSPNHVEAAKDCTFLRVRYDRPLMEKDLALYKYLAGMLMQKMNAASEGNKRQMLSLSQRFADYLLAASNDGIFSGSYGDAASVLGCSYRQLMRITRQFYADGLISREGKSVQLLDIGRLRGMAEGGE